MEIYYNRQCRNCLEHRKEPNPPPEVDAGVGGATLASLFTELSRRQFWVSVFGSEDRGDREAQDTGYKIVVSYFK